MRNFLVFVMLYLFGALPLFAKEPTPTPTVVEHKIANFTNNTVENLQYSSYKLGGKHFDLSKGVYVLDCSSYVDHILKAACPVAYHRLVNVAGNIEPTSRDYYEFFKSLPKNNPQRLWNRVENVKALHAGDILVFRFGNSHSTAPGHVMVVMNKPIQKINTFAVRVADSAAVRHSKDTRAREVSGVGIGTMLLKANPTTGKPYAYAWQVGSHWQHHVSIAMARPLDHHPVKTTVVTRVQVAKGHRKVKTTITVTHHHTQHLARARRTITTRIVHRSDKNA